MWPLVRIAAAPAVWRPLVSFTTWLMLAETFGAVAFAASRALLSRIRCAGVRPSPPDAPHPVNVLLAQWFELDGAVGDGALDAGGLPLVYTYTVRDRCYTYRFVYNFKRVPILFFFWVGSVMFCLGADVRQHLQALEEKMIAPLRRAYRKLRRRLPGAAQVSPTWEPGDLCPICLCEAESPYDAAPRQPVTYCRWRCGKVVHVACMEQWAKRRDVCVYCSTPW